MRRKRTHSIIEPVRDRAVSSTSISLSIRARGFKVGLSGSWPAMASVETDSFEAACAGAHSLLASEDHLYYEPSSCGYTQRIID